MIRFRQYIQLAAVLFSIVIPVAVSAAPPSTTVPEQRLTPEWRAERHVEKVAQAKAGDIDLVMIGDSITHNWEKQKTYNERFAPYNTLNLGVGGDRTQNVLWRLQNGEIDGISPKLVTLMIGTNNSGRDSAPDIAIGIKTVVAELRQRLPEAKIVVLSVFPRNHPRTKGDFEQVKAINKLLPAIADNQHVFHVDINQNFLDAKGQLRPELFCKDRLHLASAGYDVWYQALQPILKEAGLKGAQSTQKAAATPIIRLWPIERVGGEPNRLKEVYRDSRGKPQLCGIKDPYLTVFKADSDKPTPAVVYCPGGAYKILHPQRPLIEWLNAQGITVFMLKYTIPDQPDAAFEDIQRAMRLVRHRAKQWNIDPDNIGVVGNSAGGHLAARLTQNYLQQGYDPIDGADAVSCEPNFAVLQCAAYFQGRRMDKEFDAELFHMKTKVAPTFLTYAKDDKFSKGGVEYAKRLKEAGGTIELKLFEKGGHGMSACDWFTPAAQWLKLQNVVGVSQ
jgi:acetyl esterase/lipase/lysophospholipase L1-like esterase